MADSSNSTGAPGANTRDEVIHRAWLRRQSTYEQLQALPLGAPLFGDALTPEEKACWDVIDAAEEEIRASIARTPAGAAIQLKTGLAASLSDREQEAALMRGDLVFLECAGLEWSERLMVAALRSLEAMGERAATQGGA